MAGRRRPPDDGLPGRRSGESTSRRSLLEQALPGVRRLPPGPRQLEPHPPSRRPRAPASAEEPVRFELRVEGERIEGGAPGIDRAHLRRLRCGEWSVDLEVDLHGLPPEAARRELAAALADALAEGLRCVRVVHGRGLHSRGEPVLKRALPEWLAEPPHGPRVLAFASAPARHGGPGATLVLLRRRRVR